MAANSDVSELRKLTLIYFHLAQSRTKGLETPSSVDLAHRVSALLICSV